MAWKHNNGKSASKLAARLVDESSSILKLVKDNEKKNPAYVSAVLGQEVASILVTATVEIDSEIGDSAARVDLGWAEKVGRKKAIQDVAYYVKRELKAKGINTRLLDNRASINAVRDAMKAYESHGMVDGTVSDRIRNLTNGLHGMQFSDTKLTNTEKALSGLTDGKKAVNKSNKSETKTSSSSTGGDNRTYKTVGDLMRIQKIAKLDTVSELFGKSERELRKIEDKAIRKMSDKELAKHGLVRVPGYTRKDGVKVKAHIRKLSK